MFTTDDSTTTNTATTSTAAAAADATTTCFHYCRCHSEPTLGCQLLVPPQMKLGQFALQLIALIRVLCVIVLMCHWCAETFLSVFLRLHLSSSIFVSLNLSCLASNSTRSLVL